MASDPTALACAACDRTYEPEADEPWRCDCGRALTFESWPLPDGRAPAFSKLDTRNGLWTFFEFLPISRQVTFGEGFTPLVDDDEWGAQFKLEYVFPTGSFKDRGATTTVSRAVELGVDAVVEDSSGNAGASIATYAAHAGLDAEIYVPAELPQSKLVAIQRTGAKPVRVEGGRAAASEACVEAAERGDGWYASHAWNPAFLAGTMTFALELAAQRDWDVPDVVVLPTGNGTLFLGAYLGFRALREAGTVDEMPRLVAAQATGYAPIVDAVDPDERERTPDRVEQTEADADEPATRFPIGDSSSTTSAGTSSGGGLDAGDSDDSAVSDSNEIADGIHIRDPPRLEQIVRAVERTDGHAIAIDEDRLELALDRLHRAGYYVEPTAAVGPAALRALRELDLIGPEDDVVVPLTGSGANTM